MITFARTDTSLLGRWWWTVDRWMMLALFALMFCGAILVLAASPAVSQRIGLDRFYLARHHLMMLPVAAAIIFSVSTLNLKTLRRLSVIGFAIALGLTALTLVAGSEIKGATRWVSIGGFSLQPSEFLKPTFAIVAAWLLAAQHGKQAIPGNLSAWRSSLSSFSCCSGSGHDRDHFGRLVRAVLPGRAADHLGRAAGERHRGVTGAYFSLAHVRERIDSFLDPAVGDAARSDARWRRS
jgi:cell division protein FtsW